MFFIQNDSENQSYSLNYINLVKDHLFTAKKFTLTPVALPCTDMDPNKELVIAYNNKTIAICDVFPNFPVNKFSGVYIDQDAFQYVENVNFLNCVDNCLSLKSCMALSHDSNEDVCYMYNSTDGDFVTVKGIITITFNQPETTIRDWISFRNTRAVGNSYENKQTDTFLDCLHTCDSSAMCYMTTYEFSTKLCKLFSSSQNNSFNSAYGTVTALHVNVLRQNENDEWRFTEYTEKKFYVNSHDLFQNGTKKGKYCKLK
jgi:hypothetical protein